MKYKTVIFDLDGTLIDSLESIVFSMNKVLEQHGLELHTADKYKQFVGNGRRELVKKSIPVDLRTDKKIDLLYDEMSIIYNNCWKKKMKPYVGIIELLNHLNKSNISININTSRDISTTNQIISEYFPTVEFDYIIARDSLKSKKPNPDGINYIIKKLNAEKHYSLFVGDSDVDIETALNGGISCASVTWGYRTEKDLLEYNANKIIRNTNELKYLINNNR